MGDEQEFVMKQMANWKNLSDDAKRSLLDGNDNGLRLYAKELLGGIETFMAGTDPDCKSPTVVAMRLCYFIEERGMFAGDKDFALAVLITAVCDYIRDHGLPPDEDELENLLKL